MSGETNIPSTNTLLDLYASNKKFPAQWGDVFLLGNAINNDVEAIEDLIKGTQVDSYKLFTYDVNGNITRQDIYTDDTGTTQLFEITYGYTGSNLTLITVIRTSDSYTYTKTLAYDINNNLTSITIVTI